MAISSYQVEWLIHQRRRWRGLVNMVERALDAAPDKTELSAEGRMQAAERRASDAATAQPGTEPGAEPMKTKTWPADLAERKVYPQPVAYELERRAGSFMRPRFIPSNAPAPIPRVDLWDAVRQEEDDG